MELSELLPLIIPLAVIQLALIAFSLKDLLNPERRVKGGNKLVWGLIIVFINLIGPLAYFFAGREEA